MANEFASQAAWSINSITQGNKRLRKMEDYDVSSDAAKEAQNEVGSDFPVGFVRKPGAKTISFTFREAKGRNPEIDWEYLESSDEVFSLTKQVIGGQRVQYPECQVSTTGTSGDKDGTHTRTVEILVLKEKKL